LRECDGCIQYTSLMSLRGDMGLEYISLKSLCSNLWSKIGNLNHQNCILSNCSVLKSMINRIFMRKDQSPNTVSVHIHMNSNQVSQQNQDCSHILSN